jgi:hypothetical protein
MVPTGDFTSVPSSQFTSVQEIRTVCRVTATDQGRWRGGQGADLLTVLDKE